MSLKLFSICITIELIWKTVLLRKERRKRNKKRGKEKKKLLCPLQLCQNDINSPNICFIVASSIPVSHGNKKKSILISGSLEKFIGDYRAHDETNKDRL